MRERIGATKGEIAKTLQLVGLELTADQAAPVYDTESSVICVAGGEGAGKSITAAAIALTRLIYSPLIWIIGPDYNLCKPEFDYLCDWLLRLGFTSRDMISAPIKGRRVISTTLGGEIVTMTGNDVEKIAGRGPNLIIIVEAAQQSRSVFQRALTRVARAEHPEYKTLVVLAGTFEEAQPWYDEIWEELGGDNLYGGRAYSIPMWSNTFLFPGGIKDAEILRLKSILPPDVFTARCAARPVKPPGLVIPEFSHTLHVSNEVEYEPGQPVYLWIDPGSVGSFYAVEAVQLYGRYVNVFDEIYIRYGQNEDAIREAKKQIWWGDVRGGVIDIHGRARSTEKSPYERWQAVGVNLRAQYLKVPDNIRRHREYLAMGDERPYLMYNPTCGGAIREYRYWTRKKDPATGEFTGEAGKYNCDALKAIGYGLVINFGYATTHRRPPDQTKRRNWGRK